MGSLALPGMAERIKYVQFLHDASEIKFRTGGDENNNGIILQLPVLKPPVEIPVLEIFLK
jgi:alpha-L-fucosidase